MSIFFFLYTAFSNYSLLVFLECLIFLRGTSTPTCSYILATLLVCLFFQNTNSNNLSKPYKGEKSFWVRATGFEPATTWPAMVTAHTAAPNPRSLTNIDSSFLTV